MHVNIIECKTKSETTLWQSNPGALRERVNPITTESAGLMKSTVSARPHQVQRLKNAFYLQVFVINESLLCLQASITNAC